jgi:hypothetical protein
VIHEELAPLSSDQSDATEWVVEASPGLPARAVRGVFVLLLVTFTALCAAWAWPDNTALHFWLVAQVVPVFYIIFAWWSSSHSESA